MNEWITTTDRDGRRAYVRADGCQIDGHGYGRMKWTVVYPSGDYGMTDSLGEAKAWADVETAKPATLTDTEHDAIDATMTVLLAANAVDDWAPQQPGRPYFHASALLKAMLVSRLTKGDAEFVYWRMIDGATSRDAMAALSSARGWQA